MTSGVTVDSSQPIHPPFVPVDNVVLNAMNMTYNAGAKMFAVGEPKNIGIKELDDIGAKRHPVLGDGSCWSRATWQCVFSQVLDDDSEFDRFVDQIAHPKEGYDIPDVLAKDVIHILYKLKGMSQSQRFDYLNHTNVDDSLVFYMRHVAGEFMSKNY
ncbi:MAG: hypothetical protein ACE5GN_01070, partial [Waddliaceae bacterium]